jgi:hypothetical protein
VEYNRHLPWHFFSLIISLFAILFIDAFFFYSTFLACIFPDSSSSFSLVGPWLSFLSHFDCRRCLSPEGWIENGG